MSMRLQVIVDDKEMREIRRAARHSGLTVSEWVRSAMRQARRSSSGADPATKLAVVRAASLHAFPTGSVEQMLAEIESGYLDGSA
jgi:hypothetical protein